VAFHIRILYEHKFPFNPPPNSATLALLSLYGVCFNVLQFAPQFLNGPIVENRLVIRQYRMIKNVWYNSTKWLPYKFDVILTCVVVNMWK